MQDKHRLRKKYFPFLIPRKSVKNWISSSFSLRYPGGSSLQSTAIPWRGSIWGCRWGAWQQDVRTCGKENYQINTHWDFSDQAKKTKPVNLYIMLPSALFHRNEKVAIKKISPFEHQTYCQVTFLQKDIDWWSLREDKFCPTLKCRRHVIWPIESMSSIFTTLDVYGDIFLRL